MREYDVVRVVVRLVLVAALALALTLSVTAGLPGLSSGPAAVAVGHSSAGSGALASPGHLRAATRKPPPHHDRAGQRKAAHGKAAKAAHRKAAKAAQEKAAQEKAAQRKAARKGARREQAARDRARSIHRMVRRAVRRPALVTTLTGGPTRISVDTAPAFTFESRTRHRLRFVCTLRLPGGERRVGTCPAKASGDGTSAGRASYPDLPPSVRPYVLSVRALVPARVRTRRSTVGPVRSYRWRVYAVTSPKHMAPRTGPTFNNPLGSSAARRRNLSHVIDTIRSMPGYAQPATSSAPCPTSSSGLVPSTIRVTLYSMTDARFAQALVAAARRCVSVQILMNNHLSASTDDAWRRLQEVVGTNRAALSFARRCSYGCRGKGVMHTKMYLFDSSVPAPGAAANLVDDTVMVGSSNMTQNAAKVQWNDLYTVAGDGVLFGQLRDYFDLMKQDQGVRRNQSDYVDGRHRIRTSFWPVARRRTDPERAALQSVRCSGARHGTGIRGHSVVYVNMHAWFGTRGLRMADDVRRLYDRGCSVRILYSFMTKRVYYRLTHHTGRRMSARRTIFSLDRDEYADVYTHFKNLLVSGHVGADHQAQVVWTGSNNFTSDGSHFDEVMMRIRSASAFRAYRAHFRFISARKSSSRFASFLEPLGGGRAPGQTLAARRGAGSTGSALGSVDSTPRRRAGPGRGD